MNADEMDDATEPDEDMIPPSPDRVARRTIVLGAVAGRGVMEMQAAQSAEVAEHHPRLEAWLEAADVLDECEADEIEVIRRPVGELTPQESVNATWRLEGLGVLAWALQLFEMPQYDTLVDVNDLFPAIGFLNVDGAKAILDSAATQLRPSDELDELSAQMLALHWRVRDYSLRPQAMDFREFGENCWFGPIDISWAELVNDDLAIEGTAISDASEELVSRTQSLAMERHLAINWLQGWSEIYSETDTST